MEDPWTSSESLPEEAHKVPPQQRIPLRSVTSLPALYQCESFTIDDGENALLTLFAEKLLVYGIAFVLLVLTVLVTMLLLL